VTFYAEAAKAEAYERPMILTAKGITLNIDGDGLCYYCAGNDSTAPEEALGRVIDKVRAAQAQTNADQVNILMTASGSDKGNRYAIARVKPYQGQRANSRRPKNWSFLRHRLASGIQGYGTYQASNAEADDLFGVGATPNTVIFTQDKDMRMIPGWHLEWETHTFFKLREEQYEAWHNGKLYGTKWFWAQMLMGDTADNIPGLPRYVETNAKTKLQEEKKIGEVTTLQMLDGTTSSVQAGSIVGSLYESYYGKRWLVEMLEQAALLWMRRERQDDWLDCGRAPWSPMAMFADNPLWESAVAEIQGRVDSVPREAES
jgi:hypothetical protein